MAGANDPTASVPMARYEKLQSKLVKSIQLVEHQSFLIEIQKNRVSVLEIQLQLEKEKVKELTRRLNGHYDGSDKSRKKHVSDRKPDKVKSHRKQNSNNTLDAPKARKQKRRSSKEKKRDRKSVLDRSKSRTKKDGSIPGWSKDEVAAWLHDNALGHFEGVFLPGPKKGLLTLEKATDMDLITLSALPTNSVLNDAWDLKTFVRDFFLTYRNIITPSDLMTKTHDRYNKMGGKDPAVSLVSKWLFLDDGADFLDDTLLQQFYQFCDMVGADDTEAASQLRMQAKKQLSTLKNPPDDKGLWNCPSPVVPLPGFTVTDLDPLEIARQMTLMSEALFCKISSKEFHDGAFNYPERSPNLSGLIALTNNFSRWVSTEILKQFQTENAAHIICHFIVVADHLMTLRNFNGCMAVASALHLSAISKLKSAWEIVNSDKKMKDLFDGVTKLCNAEGKFATYRAQLAKLNNNLPTIPLLSVICLELAPLQEVTKTKLEDGRINWYKLEQVAKRIWDVKRFTAKYSFKAVKEIQDYITNAPKWREEGVLYAIAKLREEHNAAMQEQANLQKSTKAGSQSLDFANLQRGGSVSRAFSEKSPRVLKFHKRARTRSSAVSNDGNKRATPDVMSGVVSYNLSERDWQILIAVAKVKSYRLNATIVKQFQRHPKVYRIKSGAVRQMSFVKEKLIRVESLAKGSLCNCHSLLDMASPNQYSGISIVADKNTELWEFDTAFVLRLIREKEYLARKLFGQVAFSIGRSLAALEENNQAPTMSQEDKRVSGRGMRRTNLDARFNQRFHLTEDVVIRSFQCSLKGTIGATGCLYLSQNHLCFSNAKLFQSKEVIAWKDIVGIKKLNKNAICVQLHKNKSYIFHKFEDADPAFPFIHSFWEHSRSSGSQSNVDKKLQLAKSAILSTSGVELDIIKISSSKLSLSFGSKTLSESKSSKELRSSKSKDEKSSEKVSRSSRGPEDKATGEDKTIGDVKKTASEMKKTSSKEELKASRAKERSQFREKEDKSSKEESKSGKDEKSESSKPRTRSKPENGLKKTESKMQLKKDRSNDYFLVYSTRAWQPNFADNGISDIFYCELELTSVDPQGLVILGLDPRPPSENTSPRELHDMPGVAADTYGFSSDGAFNNSNHNSKHAWHAKGRRVGIGMRRSSGKIFATLDGEVVHSWNRLPRGASKRVRNLQEFREKETSRGVSSELTPYFPVVGFKGAVSFRINFKDNFSFDIRSYMGAGNMKQSTGISFERALKKEDWKRLLDGSTEQVLPKDSVVLEQGAKLPKFTKLFRVQEGSVRVERYDEEDGAILELGILKEGSIFGEDAFLSGTAIASVIVDTENTRISTLYGYYLEIMFAYSDELTGRFFHLLAKRSFERLQQLDVIKAKAKSLKGSANMRVGAGKSPPM